jgi:hypothetical protein
MIRIPKNYINIFKGNIRKIYAVFFLILILILFILSVTEDYKLKNWQQRLGPFPPFYINNYYLNLTSLDLDTGTVKGTLSFVPGPLPLPIEDVHKLKLFYGSLRYVDLTYGYVFLDVDLSLTLFKTTGLSETFSTNYPRPVDISIMAIGNPEIYPFDKYFIVAAVACHVYYKEGNKKIYGQEIKGEQRFERLHIKNSIPGLFIRHPKKKELDEIKKLTFLKKKPQPTEDKEMRELNNFQNRFALIMERSSYLKLMTIILGIIAFFSAYYIGFKTPFNAIAIQVIGYIIGLWGIRSILLGDLRIFPSYFEYAVLSTFLILFSGIIFRKIKGS